MQNSVSNTMTKPVLYFIRYQTKLKMTGQKRTSAIEFI